MPRFNKTDAAANRTARQILRTRNATPEDKENARRTIERLNHERNRRVEARKSAGEQPQRKQFETEADYRMALQQYWAKLDRAVAEREAWKVLNDPTSSTLVRTRAYERLGIRPPETPGTVDYSESQKPEPKITAKHSLSDTEFAEERRREQKFYDELAEMLAAEKEKGKIP